MTHPPTGRLEIGRYYHVPCVQAGPFPPNYARPGEWIPVLLPEHDDKEILGFPWKHYHLDFRFLSARADRLTTHGTGLIQYPIKHYYSGKKELDTSEPAHLGVIEYRRLKCKRDFPAWYPHYSARAWFPALQERYKCATLKPGRVCPHRGLDLSGCPVVGGVVVCPGHGLLFSAETGAVVLVPAERLR